MMEKLKYVSPEYEERLRKLAELICTPGRYNTVVEEQLPGQLELPIE